ncbi:protein phosphatase 2C domain-containing protein [Streptomyces sp. PSKA01]|uniref:Protein phosphatase 2C domain-containing protein n=2 Tax=Streptomyces cupreus TaxID=2759956 RepID=A0A7X1IYP1_9ACTN|nr:PP2C family serine/threonine-protein phosphatase [Streptomyces cupreus]MBC2901020.1 protein phosphatase 2C domain-containing protein [Streptomyces cupreus]
MSQMPQQAALSKCPSCAEPLQSGDRFCEKCGYDLSALADTPAAVNGTAPPPPPGAADVAWPGASEPDSSDTPAAVHLPADLQGSASDGRGRPPADHGGVRFDRAPEPDEYPLQAPDPRIAAEQPAPAEAAKVCVACRAGRVDHDGYCENCGHAQPRERDHMEQECGPIAAVSDRGLRHHRNEDAFAVGCTALADGSPAVLAIVCDGVSSATRPDDASLAASRAASDTLLAALPHGTHPQQAMHEAIVAASRAVNALAGEPATAREHAPHQNAPACTLVGAVITSGLLVVGWVGDSRVYWVPVDRSAPPARLTEDDSWAAQMVAAGLMNEAEAYADERAHAITGWLGADAYELEPHTASFKPDRPGVVVVCTDGLWNYAEAAEEMADVVPLDAAVRPLHSAQVLVGHALDGGGHDNVTVAVLPFPAPPMGAGSA